MKVLQTLRPLYEELLNIVNTTPDMPASKVLVKLTPYIRKKSGKGSRSGKLAVYDQATGLPRALFCTYHKKWELVPAAHYTKKSTSPTGYATACAEGTLYRRKQLADHRRSLAHLMNQITDGLITQAELKAANERDNLLLKRIIPRIDQNAYESKADVVRALRPTPSNNPSI